MQIVFARGKLRLGEKRWEWDADSDRWHMTTGYCLDSQLSIDIPTILDTQYQHGHLLLLNAVENDVILARMNAANTGVPNQLFRAWASRVFGQEVDPAGNPPLYMPGKITQSTFCSVSEND